MGGRAAWTGEASGSPRDGEAGAGVNRVVRTSAEREAIKELLPELDEQVVAATGRRGRAVYEEWLRPYTDMRAALKARRTAGASAAGTGTAAGATVAGEAGTIAAGGAADEA